MSHIIKVNDDKPIDGRTLDSIRYCKDCRDFICLDDGTILGENRYCNLSMQCQQIDVGIDGKPKPMEAHILPIIDQVTREEIAHELFCTGLYDYRPLKERIEDDKVS